MAVNLRLVVRAELERGQARDRAGHADRIGRLEVGQRLANGLRGGFELALRGRVRVEEALGQPDAADVDARAARGRDQLGRAAADVEHERVVRPSLRPFATPRRVSSASSSPESRRVVKP